MTGATPWWQSDSYTIEAPLPDEFVTAAGPEGVALVKAWPDGRTDQGWGLLGPKSDPTNGFAQRYPRGEFNSRRVLYGYNKGRWAFAFIMRSLNVVCIDIDGKNGGLEEAKKLGMLPHTLAETSKSGNGFHLFYKTDELWTPDKGFGELSDRIGIQQGVDIRAVGCVYHHDTQRWNYKRLAPLPDHLREQLLHRDQKIAATTARITTVLGNNDDMEILMLHDEMLLELAKPIPQGKRNNTLFAIGSQMAQAQVPDWDVKLGERAMQVGLDLDEIVKLTANIRRTVSVP